MFSRRKLLENSGLLAVGSLAWPSWMPRLFFREDDQPARGDVLLVVFARGGYDGLNMVVPYGEEGNYFDVRPNIAIPGPDSTAAVKATDLDGFFGLHPTLVNNGWHELYQEGVLGVVHAMHQADPTRSHFDAMDYMERGTPGEKRLDTGWLGRHLDTMANSNGSPFRAVGLGSMVQASLRGPVPAVALQSIADFHLRGREHEVERFQRHLQSLYGGDGWLDEEGEATFAAMDMLEQAVGGGDGYQPAHGANYSEQDSFDRGLMQIAQLVKADVGLEVACIDIGGWDTHANQVSPDSPVEGNMANLLNRLSRGLTAFMTDLRDYWSEPGVTVTVMSEFGRRSFENGGRGTDHGHGNCMFLMGKGISGGTVHGSWPGLAPENLNRGDLDGTTEYRDILGEVLAKRLGNQSIDQVFPNHRFNFLGVAEERDDAPTPVEPTPAPGEPPARDSEIYLPWANRG